ncbi:hypothetical protein CEXT_718861 [Caerostris extrusa]|uniref:Uncharacterized protein n=1 Tax=Caerostris extrusa TaxID=172846 RepID=A0AAV4P4M2_CAEEX|nr:hypothetical protein CEXT_718861 [Caerostris extrusa]
MNYTQGGFFYKIGTTLPNEGYLGFQIFITQYRGAFQKEPVGSASLEDKTGNPSLNPSQSGKVSVACVPSVLHGSFHFPRDFVGPPFQWSVRLHEMCGDLDRENGSSLGHRLGGGTVHGIVGGVPVGYLLWCPVVFWVCMNIRESICFYLTCFKGSKGVRVKQDPLSESGSNSIDS